jgi:alpha-L-fucosidase
MLVDIVSRNGNLMLNFPLPASGMLDSDELAVLDGITRWMAINSEGIYATRPWKIFGEGPQTDNAKKEANGGQQFNESRRKQLTYQDVRFTTKGNTLYAFIMGWPEGDEKQITIKPLGLNSPHKTGTIENVELLGYGKVAFTRDTEGLKITLPANKPGEHAFTFKIAGQDLV